MKVNEKGITIIALVITVVVTIIILTITTTTVMDSYRNMQMQNFSAEMRMIQSGIDNFHSKYTNWDGNNENDYSLGDDIERTTVMDYLDFLGCVIANEDSRLTATEKAEYKALIETLRDQNLSSWRIEDGDFLNYYYLTPADMENLFGIKDLKQNVLVNFLTRNVVSVNGIRTLERDSGGELIRVYREYDLPGGQRLIEEIGRGSSKLGLYAKRLVVKNDYVTVQLYFNAPRGETYTPEQLKEALSEIGRIREVYAFRISEEEYDEILSARLNAGTNIEDIDETLKDIAQGKWSYVEKFKYNEINKTVELDLVDPGFYYFRVVDYIGGKSRVYETDEYIYVAYYNIPVPPQDETAYIPVKFIPGSEIDKSISYNASKTFNENTIYAVVCTTDDPEWYDYQPNRNSKWANIMLLDGSYNKTASSADYAAVGRVLDESSKYGSIYVWIPRYAYKVYNANNVGVTFLKRHNFKSKRWIFSTSSI